MATAGTRTARTMCAPFLQPLIGSGERRRGLPAGMRPAVRPSRSGRFARRRSSAADVVFRFAGSRKDGGFTVTRLVTRVGAAGFPHGDCRASRCRMATVSGIAASDDTEPERGGIWAVSGPWETLSNSDVAVSTEESLSGTTVSGVMLGADASSEAPAGNEFPSRASDIAGAITVATARSKARFPSSSPDRRATAGAVVRDVFSGPAGSDRARAVQAGSPPGPDTPSLPLWGDSSPSL